MSNILIWDTEDPPPAPTGTTVLWRAFTTGTSSECVSIPQLIEESADALRARYLAWVYELGEMHLRGHRLVDHLQLHPGFSYWWMTLLVEKCNWSKSPQIDDAIRLLAFTDWATGRALAEITLASANRPLAACLRGWCEKSGVAFKWQRLPEPAVSLSWIRRAYTALPHTVQAWVWLLKYLLERWPLRGVGLQEWRQTKGSVTFVSYLDNLVPEAAKAGRYESRYWAHLPDVLRREGCKSNWLHLYVKDAFLPNANKAAEIVQAFNRTGQGMEVHTTLDTFLSVRTVRQALRDWLKLAWKGQRLKGLIAAGTSQAPLDLWPLFTEDWEKSTCGTTAMANALFRSLFDAAIKRLPKQQIGCYLQENQAWEFALIQTWKAAHQGRLISVPHSSVRFWDLRYFFDPRSYPRTGHNDLPLPDQVAVNGPAATDAYLTGGYPANDLVQVEALRYLHLEKTRRAEDSAPGKMDEPVRLLVLGDYLARNTQLQMRLLEQAMPFMAQPMNIVVKPHPNCPIQPADYPTIPMQVSMEPIAKLLPECDIAYTSAVTSAALDAYCAGMPVVSVLDPTTLNQSPLRGSAGALFASTPEALAEVLAAAVNSPKVSLDQSVYFTVDAQLPNWRRLLL